jgi:hypothetical protein
MLKAREIPNSTESDLNITPELFLQITPALESNVERHASPREASDCVCYDAAQGRHQGYFTLGFTGAVGPRNRAGEVNLHLANEP